MRIVWTIRVQEIVRHFELNQVAEIFISRGREFFLNHLLKVFISVIHLAEMMRFLILVGVTDLDAFSFGTKSIKLSFLYK